MVVRSFVIGLALSSMLGLAACSGSSEGGEKSNTGDKSDSKKGNDDDKKSDSEDPPGNDDTNNDPKPTKKADGAQCKESAECKSELCVFNTSNLGMCVKTCSDDIECSLDEKCEKLADAPQKVCLPK